MSTPTLIFIRHGRVDGQRFRCGDELPPGLIPREVIDHWLDEGWLREVDAAVRPSLYRLLPRFSGLAEQVNQPTETG